jgi:hypothetical protein
MGQRRKNIGGNVRWRNLRFQTRKSDVLVTVSTSRAVLFDDTATLRNGTSLTKVDDHWILDLEACTEDTETLAEILLSSYLI